MYIQVASISVIVILIYIALVKFSSHEIDEKIVPKPDYHMGCFNEQNPLDHSSKIRTLLAQVNNEHANYLAQGRSFQIASQVNFDGVSKEIAQQFENFLNEYYHIKSKGAYEQSYYNSLNIAQTKYQNCKDLVARSFNKKDCLNTWNQLSGSDKKYQELKQKLALKIQKKQKQQKKISHLVLDTNQTGQEQYEQNITKILSNFNRQLESANTKKIELISKKTSLQRSISTTKIKYQQDQALLNECLNNVKIITFCNEVNQQVRTLQLSYSKEGIQKRIQRKQVILDANQAAIKAAQKVGDIELIEMNKRNMKKSLEELDLLQKTMIDISSFDESYCSKCSQQRISQLKIQVSSAQSLIKKHEVQYKRSIIQEQSVINQIFKISFDVYQLEEERDLHRSSRICLSEQCEGKRSSDIQELSRNLQQIKIQVLSYRAELLNYQQEHQSKIEDLNMWVSKINNLMKCLNEREYFQQLRQKRPQQSKNEVMKIGEMKSKLISKLKQLSQ